MTEIDHGPTRDDGRIDRTFVNFSRSVVESGTTDPLETDDGSRQSNHKVAYMEAEFRKDKPKVVTYSYRKYTDEGAAKFMDLVARANWSEVYSAPDTTAKAAVFQSLMDTMMDKCFEWKTTTRNERDPPWIDDKLRGLWKKRRKVFDTQARSPRWRALKKKSDYRYRTRMRRYLDNLKKNLTSDDASRNFFQLVKAFKSREKPPSFDIHDIYPDKADHDIAEDLATHFNAISSKFRGLQPADISRARSIPLVVRGGKAASGNQKTSDDGKGRHLSFSPVWRC